MEENQKQKAIDYWKKGAKKALCIANDVYEKKHYDHALFCGHLALEKLLKMKTIPVTGKPAPHSHDLLYLSALAKIDLSAEDQQFLTEVNSYNIEGRYPEERLEFYRKITKSLAEKQLKKINNFYLWLLKQ